MSSTTDTKLSSKDLYDRASKRIPGGVSHPNRYSGTSPIYIKHAQGSRMWDTEDREYVDYSMGSASLLLGHAHPDVVRAIQEQAPHGTYTASCHALEVEWAGLIQEMIPSAELVRFVGSGTESTMLAVRVARAYTGKTKVIRFEGHYNGWHDYCLTGSEVPYDEAPGNGVLQAAADATIVLPPDANRVEEVLKKDGDVAAIILEASGANWASVPLPEGIHAQLRALADKYGIVLIFDEVITGFRWSPGGVQRLVGVKPDLTCMAKIVTGGMPGGALAGRSEVMRVLDPRAASEDKVVHKGTFNGNPIVAAPAVATLSIAKTGQPQAHADKIAKKIREGMQTILTERQVAGAAYGESSVFHVYFGSNAPAKDSVAGLSPQQIRGVDKKIVAAYQQGLKDRGVNLMSYLGGVCSSAHTDKDVDDTLKAFEGTVADLMAEGLIGRA
jgi:glutamate-1-semialdehyde 2,1-aminomutase